MKNEKNESEKTGKRDRHVHHRRSERTNLEESFMHTELLLARNGKSNYQIVISRTVSDIEKHAAEELQTFLEEISQVKLPIVTDDSPMTEHEIILGDNRHLHTLNIPVNVDEFGDEGFVLRTVGKKLVIVGGRVRGMLYGVYTFLEDYLGCRWFSSKVSRIPKQNEIRIGQINGMQKPALDFREVYYSDAMEPKLAERLKLNGNASVIRNGKLAQERHRGWGLWCHTFFALVSPDKYFQSHPEYFSLVNGQRVAHQQLCLTNPDVFKITVDELKKMMAAQPDAQYWSVSQMDWAGNCQCEECSAIDEREGTPMGSLLAFINKLADEFPEKTISTLAYQYTRRPPKTLRPAKNVLIMLCSIECNRSRPIATDESNVSFKNDVENWSKICDNLFIWDYVVQFSNLVSPFPNLRVLQPNIQFLVDKHARGMFAQGNREAGGEFAELRAYLLAKLLWNPDCNVDELIGDILHGYYGEAAEPIREYIEKMHDALEQSGKGLSIFGHPTEHRDGYISPELLAQYGALFDEAERRVADDEDVLLRVQATRMPLMYAQLQLGVGDKKTRSTIADKLFNLAEHTGLLMFNEWNLPTEEYKSRVMEALAKDG